MTTSAKSVIRFASVLLVLSTSIMVSNERPAAAATVEVPASQSNIWGSSHPQGGGYLGGANLISYLVAVSDPGPWIVTVQEVCSPAYNTLLNNLPQQGYVSVRTRVVYKGGSCGWQGNALFLVGNTVGSPFTYAYNAQQGGQTETRKLTCQATDTVYLGQFVGCGTHLATQDSTAQDQEQELNDIVNFFYWPQRRIVGGDLNHDLAHPLDTHYYSNDPNGADTFRADNLYARLDYMFGSKAHFSSHRTPTPRICNISYSDHCFIGTTFRFTA